MILDKTFWYEIVLHVFLKEEVACFDVVIPRNILVINYIKKTELNLLFNL